MDFFEDLPIYVNYGSVGPGVKSSQNQGNSCHTAERKCRNWKQCGFSITANMFKSI